MALNEINVVGFEFQKENFVTPRGKLSQVTFSVVKVVASE